MKKTLLLTPWGSPTQIIHWHDAIDLKYKDKADVIEEYDVDVCSPSIQWKLPAVMRLKELPFVKRVGVKFSRGNVFLRDDYTCQYCGSNSVPIRLLTYDHVKPRTLGGKTTWENIVTCCRKCNNRKGSRTCKQANMYPMNAPVKPKYLPFTPTLTDLETAPPQWQPYLENQN